jgi:hypothetical protein
MPVNRLVGYLRLALVLVLVFPQTAPPKCILLQITLEGEIQGETKDLAVNVEVASRTKGDHVTEVRQESSIEKGRFRLIARFNTQSTVVSQERCDRLPQTVIIKLTKGNRIVDHLTLKIESDFRRTEQGDYELKIPVTLRVSLEK